MDVLVKVVVGGFEVTGTIAVAVELIVGVAAHGVTLVGMGVRGNVRD